MGVVVRSVAYRYATGGTVGLLDWHDKKSTVVKNQTMEYLYILTAALFVGILGVNIIHPRTYKRAILLLFPHKKHTPNIYVFLKLLNKEPRSYERITKWYSARVNVPLVMKPQIQHYSDESFIMYSVMFKDHGVWEFMRLFDGVWKIVEGHTIRPREKNVLVITAPQ